ncbi:hypothetical protein HN031_15050 [Nocardioides sp. zg-1308]|nr:MULTISPECIES: hypothetical protein [unclassified Nocardioides]NPD05998.1 hypothetical protein [Nocardioides sp. zg-1308]WQQ20471.1 hypothetical protein SHK17_11180 [Nocardioides sp. S-34]
MWVDSNGVLHTVGLPDPADVMTGEFRRGVDALLAAERERLSDMVDEVQTRLLEMDWSHLRSECDVESTPPPNLLHGAVQTSDDVSDAIERVQERWRLDVALALEDYID